MQAQSIQRRWVFQRHIRYLITSALLGLGACGTLPTGHIDDCGEPILRSTDLLTPAALYGTGSGWTTEVVGTKRVYSWTFTVNQMCVAAPTKDNSAVYAVVVRGKPEGIQMIGNVYHAAFVAPYSIILTSTYNAGTDHTDYFGKVENVGLRQGSLDGRTSDVVVELQVTFTTLGSASADQAKLQAFLLKIQMGMNYTLVKPQ